MSPLADLFLSRLLAAPAVLVRVQSTEGSAPRDAGAWMAVFTDSLFGTIGGGHLEHQAIERARELLALQPSKSGLEQGAAAPELMRMALGPSLGQCCGGVVYLSLQRVSAQDAATLRQQLDTPRMPVALFGGGHVGPGGAQGALRRLKGGATRPNIVDQNHARRHRDPCLYREDAIHHPPPLSATKRMQRWHRPGAL